jgi:hypothetical protein
MTGENNDQLTSEASRADCTDFIHIFLFGISFNTGLSFYLLFGKKRGIFLQSRFCDPVHIDHQYFLIRC